MGRCKVSVIVPVYGVENFVGRCFRSLMEQTLQDVEFIVVDDCTPDMSIGVIRNVMKDYPGRDVQIVSHNENKGLPSARNTGLAMAKGEYVFHCDSDDFVEPDMLETLYDEAKRKDADIVWCDWFLYAPAVVFHAVGSIERDAIGGDEIQRVEQACTA